MKNDMTLWQKAALQEAEQRQQGKIDKAQRKARAAKHERTAKLLAELQAKKLVKK